MTICTSKECPKCQFCTLDESDKCKIKIICSARNKEFIFGQRIDCEEMIKNA